MKLTGKQLYELRWFCQNVTGLKVDFYKVTDEVDKLKDRFDRLEKTANLIEEYIKKENIELSKSED